MERVKSFLSEDERILWQKEYPVKNILRIQKLHDYFLYITGLFDIIFLTIMIWIGVTKYSMVTADNIGELIGFIIVSLLVLGIVPGLAYTLQNNWKKKRQLLEKWYSIGELEHYGECFVITNKRIIHHGIPVLGIRLGKTSSLIMSIDEDTIKMDVKSLSLIKYYPNTIGGQCIEFYFVNSYSGAGPNIFHSLVPGSQGEYDLTYTIKVTKMDASDIIRICRHLQPTVAVLMAEEYDGFERTYAPSNPPTTHSKFIERR